MRIGSSPCLLVSLSPCLRCLFICATLLVAGCPRKGPVSAPTATPRASVALRVLVVNEPAVAEAINRLRGEWAERLGGELSAVSKNWGDVSATKELDFDVIVFPSRYLGELCVRGWLQPVRPGVLESDEFNAADVFPLVRRELIRWGGETMTLPLGIDLVTRSKAVDDHPSLALLAFAAPNAISSEREGTLFDSQTMKPLIAEAAFVDALQRLVESGLKNVGAGIDFAHWVPVLGFDDRMVAVSASSRNGASAFKLIAWLASAEISAQLARAGTPLVPVRRSLSSSSAWYDPQLNASDREKLSKALVDVLSGERHLMIPRIPGVDEYMVALDEAVRSAVVDKAPAKVALQRAADRWEQITNAHGRDSQRRAYLKHLGISEP